MPVSGAGFENEVVFAENADFTGGGSTGNISIDNGLKTNGQLWIGSTALNAGLTHINVGQIVSAGFDVTYVSPNIKIEPKGGTIGQYLQGDSGPALSPISGKWYIKGLSGSKTSGTSNIITVKSPPFSDQGSSTTVTLNSGSFSTAAITLTLPASAGLEDGDLCCFCATTADTLVIQAVGSQIINVGSTASSAAGTATSSAIGDSLSLRYQSSSDSWWAVTPPQGIWILA